MATNQSKSSSLNVQTQASKKSTGKKNTPKKTSYYQRKKAEKTNRSNTGIREARFQIKGWRIDGNELVIQY